MEIGWSYLLDEMPNKDKDYKFVDEFPKFNDLLWWVNLFSQHFGNLTKAIHGDIVISYIPNN